MISRVEKTTHLVHSLRERTSFVASNEVGGIVLPNNNSVLSLYTRIAHKLGVKPPMLEVLQFRTAFDYLETQNVAGLHGKLGTARFENAPNLSMKLDTVKARILNILLHHEQTALRRAGTIGVIEQRPVYVVNHTQFFKDVTPNDLRDMWWTQNLSAYKLHNGHQAAIIAVENGIEPDTLEQTKELPHKLNELGITTIRLIDLCHVMRFLELSLSDGYTSKGQYLTMWKKMVEILHDFADEPLLLHMPVGNLLQDSLFMHWVEQAMLVDVFDAISPVPFFMTIENQGPGLQRITHNNPGNDEAEYARLMPYFEMLLQAKLINAQ